MNIIQENTDELNAILKIKVEPNDYRENVDKILHDYRKKAAMPGFRPGNVPFGMIKKMYGKGVLADEINKILYNTLYDYLDKNNIDILGNPLPKENGIDFETQTEFEFLYDMGLAPQFSVNISAKEKFTKYSVIIDEKLIAKQTSDVAKRYGKVSQPELSGEDDMLIGEFTELDKNNIAKDGGIKHASSIYTADITDEKTKKSLLGLKKDDKVMLDPKKVSRDDFEMAKMLNIDRKTAEELKSKFEFKINSVYHVAPAEINQELFDKVYGKDAVHSLEEFRIKVSDELKKSLSADSEWKLFHDIREYFIEKLKLSLPDEFLKKWLVATNKEITKEQVEKEYDAYAKDLRWQLIENRIIKENNITVTREEIVEELKNSLKKYFIQYGIGEKSDEELTQLAEQTLAKEKQARQQYELLYDEKLKALFKNTFTIKEKEVTFDEFKELFRKKEKSGLLSGLKSLIGK